jgi:hypothetical protein
MGKNQYVTKRDDKWAVVGANNSKATRLTDTQDEAIQIARGIAINQKSELKIQGEDHKFRESNSYGHDLKNIKG